MHERVMLVTNTACDMPTCQQAPGQQPVPAGLSHRFFLHNFPTYFPTPTCQRVPGQQPHAQVVAGLSYVLRTVLLTSLTLYHTNPPTTTCQRAPRQQPNAQVVAGFGQVPLIGTLQQAVVVLKSDRGRYAQGEGSGTVAHHSEGRLVGQAPGAHLGSFRV